MTRWHRVERVPGASVRALSLAELERIGVGHDLVLELVAGVRCTGCGFVAALVADEDLDAAHWEQHARWALELGFLEAP